MEMKRIIITQWYIKNSTDFKVRKASSRSYGPEHEENR